ncbi:type VII secretion protein EccB [Streptomyces tendae]
MGLAVDAVVVAPSWATLVRAGTAAGGSAGGSLYLVTDTGVKGWLPTGNDVSAPGYSGAQA